MSEHSVHALVKQITPLTDSILQLILEPKHYISYQAGQYLQIICDGQAFSYSIANAPLGAQQYELHIRHSEDNPYNQLLLKHIKQHGAVTIKMPYGCCSIDAFDAQRPILFIAGGTGFAPVNAMIEQLLANADSRAFELFWGARSQSDIYMDEKVLRWQAHVSRFKYFSLLSSENKDSLLSLVLAKHPDDLVDWQIVLSGPFDMVYRIRDVLVAHGVPSSQLFSDAFSFE